jgi:hypothetical protein
MTGADHGYARSDSIGHAVPVGERSEDPCRIIE